MAKLTLARLIVRLERQPEGREILLDVLFALRRLVWLPKPVQLPPRTETHPVPERRRAA